LPEPTQGAGTPAPVLLEPNFVTNCYNLLHSVTLLCSNLVYHFHLLLQTSFVPLSSLMQRFLTSYGVYFNKKHERTGYLYQNRYKSIQCSTESYFLELLRYIHLNPVRSGIIENVDTLGSYPWTGHGALIGQTDRTWQETKSTLSYFSKSEDTARIKYNNFVLEGLKNNADEERVKFESVLKINDTEHGDKDVTQARAVICAWLYDQLSYTAVAISQRLGITRQVVARRVKVGRVLIQQKELVLE